jgi:hypothetical protein
MQARRREMRWRTVIQFLFQPGDHRFVGLPGRPWQPRGRHHSGPQLAHHQLPLFGLVGDVGGVQLIELQAARFQLFIVTSDAILVEERAFPCRISYLRRHLRRRWRCLWIGCLSSQHDSHGRDANDSRSYLHGSTEPPAPKLLILQLLKDEP